MKTVIYLGSFDPPTPGDLNIIHRCARMFGNLTVGVLDREYGRATFMSQTDRITDREGYRQYKSNPQVCAGCPYLQQCTESKDHQKTVTRHVWAESLERAVENEYTPGIQELYKLRKETIERVFALAKELHGFRYTQEYGRARMELKSALTFACMNLKKLAKKRWKNRPISASLLSFLRLFTNFSNICAVNPLLA